MPLFSMEVRHQYLNGGAYAAFAMLPLGATEKVMRRFGWSCAQMENKFTLYADRARSAASLKQNTEAAPDAPDLCFAIQFRDPDFVRYTDLPMQSGHSLVFACGPMPMKDRQPQLSAGPIVSAADLVPVQNRSFQHPVPADAAQGDLWLENLSGDQVQQLPASEIGSVMVDTSVLEVGFYRIVSQKKRIYTFAKWHDNFSLQSYPTLSVSLKYMLEVVQTLSSNSKPIQPEVSGDAPHVQLTFPARSAIWRYDFFNHNAAGAKDYAVVPAALADSSAKTPEPHVFHRVTGVPGLGGETSLAFESIHPIPLAARPSERFKLWRHKKTLIAELPTPGLDFTRAGDGAALRSSHIIHL